jgi:glycosyltransferase 2 family protein
MSKLIRIVISVALLALVVWFADWPSILAVLKKIQPEWALLAFAMSAADRVILTFRWQALLASQGVHLSFARLLKTLLAANFIGSFLPSSLGVDAVRIAALLRAGQPPAIATASTLVDRATMVLATFLFGSATILVLTGTRVPPHLAQFVFVMTIVGVLVCAAAFHPAVRRWAHAKLLPWIPARVRDAVSQAFSACLAYARDARALAWLVVTTVAVFAVRIVFAKAVGLACGVNVPFEALLTVIPILWIIVMLPITIGGFGVQEVGYVAVMSLVGVPPAVAVSMSLVEHIVVRAVTLPGALFIGAVTSRAPRETNPLPTP